jgi:hypothetical protein
VRRRDLTAPGAIARGKCGSKIVNAPFTLADVNERTDHRAHLVLQK